jgi:catechol O-methyltransferase
MGKESRLLEHLLANAATLRGKPQQVLKAIDDFPEQFMNIGPAKGAIICEKIKEVRAKVMIELGGYVGYSAVLFSSALPEDGKYYSFELSEEYASIARQVIDLAGLGSKVEIIIGPAAKNLPIFAQDLKKQGNKLDFVFIDHLKSAYVPDTRVLETVGLIKPGVTVVADNIVRPGAPEFVQYINETRGSKKAFIQNTPNMIDGKEFPGQWDLLYLTKIYDVTNPGGHKDAISISEPTTCTS